MKSLLILAAIAALIPWAAPASAQVASPAVAASPSPAVAASPTPASASAPAASVSPAPGASVTPAPAGAQPGNAHDAAATVPLPGQAGPGPALEKSMPLIPEAVPATSKGRHSGKSATGSASPKEFATFSSEEDIRARLRLRHAKTVVLNEQAVQDEWTAAHRVPTDPERRRLLTIYYNDVFARIIKLDPAVTQMAKAEHDNAIGRMKYTRLEDTVFDRSMFASPTPTPSNFAPDAPDAESR